MPYYRDLFKSLRFKPARLTKDIAYLQDLPYLTKDIIRQEGDRLLNESFLKDNLHVRNTSGSTGPSVRIYYSLEALDYTAAVNLLVLEWAGKKRHYREVHLSSKFPQTFPLKDRLRERVKCAALNRTNIYTDSLDDHDLEQLWQELRYAKPYLLQAHPSTMYTLALHLKRRGYRLSQGPKIFESTGELLDDNKRETIEEVCQCQVINRYGNAEFGVVAYEQLDHQQHWLKILDFLVYPETSQTDESRQELVLTGLLNPAMPLIRYRTGDLAEMVNGENGIYLTNLMGRIHDFVKIGRKTYPTHYIQDVLERIGGIDEFQIEQRNGQQPLLRLVLSPNQDSTIPLRKVENLWGQFLDIKSVQRSELRRAGRGNKFNYVVPAVRDRSASGQEGLI